MTAMSSPAKRQADRRRRMQAAGYVMMRDWVHQDDVQSIRDQIMLMNEWRAACGLSQNAEKTRAGTPGAVTIER